MLSSSSVNIILVTDGGLGHGPHSLAHLRDADAFFGLPVRGSITVVCLDPDATNAEDGTSPPSKAAYESLCSASGLSPSRVLFPEGAPTRQAAEKIFDQVIEEQYKPYVGRLQMGDELFCQVISMHSN